MKKINRILICNTTGREITIKPDKYEKLLNYYGSEKKLKKMFTSYHVEKETRTPTMEFWFSVCSESKQFKKLLYPIFKAFKDSKRTQSDILDLQNNTNQITTNSNIKLENIEFVIDNDERGGFATALRVKNIPFIKEHTYKIL